MKEFRNILYIENYCPREYHMESRAWDNTKLARESVHTCLGRYWHITLLAWPFPVNRGNENALTKRADCVHSLYYIFHVNGNMKYTCKRMLSQYVNFANCVENSM